jgi:hypothetical protein
MNGKVPHYSEYLIWKEDISMKKKTKPKKGEEQVERLPLTLGDVAPGEGFTRLSIPAREGRHTGGPFLSPDGSEVWKPLDGRPYPNAGYRVATQEDVVLELMAGTIGFPRNWRVQQAYGRRFLVRKLARVIPETFEVVCVTKAHVLQIEQALRLLNAKYWTIGDLLKVAIDPETQEPFVLDLSIAYPMGSPTASPPYKADDSWVFERWAKEVVGHSQIVKLRGDARHVVHQIRWVREHGHRHWWVYGSSDDVMDERWPGTAIPNAIYVPADKQGTGMYSWVVVPAQLSNALVSYYHLVWGWAPIVYEAEVYTYPGETSL